ncbi:LPS-assembly protein LptD [Oxalobacteraceae bacterium R-40]|uniref:LPS-assembly protein LptD n=1 Tax=Keguizhuia sedimenti TaxID=3064264 RepID=A0ABU1BIN1_9BURK|nr:LPS-assembly protein LptD [Oxalobacteraceae bacterium R-40]
MTWFLAFFQSKPLFRVVTVTLAAVSLPTVASAQTAPTAQTDDNQAPTTLEAEKMTGRPEREIILEENVEITRGPTVLNADKATYDIVEDQVEAFGDIRVRRNGDRFTGKELKLKIDTGQGYVLCPTYQLELNNAQGEAERIDFISREEATVTQGTYSTCEGPDPDWYLRASKLDLDQGAEKGTAYGSVVYFKDVPILGMPVLSFPLTDARKSGVLPPTLGTSSRGGVEITVPYYFNIAPQRDLTIYPRVISKRGMQLGMQGRYLGETYSGETRVEGMPDDQLYGQARHAISSTHTQTVAPRLTYTHNLNAASDDEYPNDFSSTITAASQRLLTRDMRLSYSESFWSGSIRASNYQVLQDPRSWIRRPYDRLPQIGLQAGKQNVNGFDWTIASEFTSFTHPDFVQGERLVIKPRVTYPIVAPGYFITPSVSVHGSYYSLSDTDAATNRPPGSLSRVLPTVSVDSGLIFERETNFLGQEAIQTLEPRLFYVYTPYRNQTNFSWDQSDSSDRLFRNQTFDTGLSDINFAQIFSENRFTGNDLVSDANQLTAALVSRYVEPSGVERMRFAIAQRYYFSDQRVVAEFLDRASEENRSDILLAASGQVTETIAVDANMRYSATQRATTQSNYGVRWQPAPKRVLNLQYRRDVPNDLELTDFSAQWPIAQRWYGVGRVNYSMRENKVAEGLLGLEYQADCWIFRIVGQRTPTATGVTDTSLFVQLELTGLSKIGSNPLRALQQNVPGYQIINEP